VKVVTFHEANDKVSSESKYIPQRLKPHFIWRLYGTAEAEPFQNHGLFINLNGLPGGEAVVVLE
jgi:hypothetical protein